MHGQHDDYQQYNVAIENIANQIGAGYGAECLEDIDDIEREEIWEDLPDMLYGWFWDHDKSAIGLTINAEYVVENTNGQGAWPTEAQIKSGLVGLGYVSKRMRDNDPLVYVDDDGQTH